MCDIHAYVVVCKYIYMCKYIYAYIYVYIIYMYHTYVCIYHSRTECSALSLCALLPGERVSQ